MLRALAGAMRFQGMAAVGLVFFVLVTACGGSSASDPQQQGQESPAAGSAGLNAGGSVSSSGAPAGGAGGMAPEAGGSVAAGTAGTGGYPPNGTCPWAGSWEVETCLTLPAALARVAGAGGAGGAGGVAGSPSQAPGGAAGDDALGGAAASDPVEPACPILTPGTPDLHGAPTVKGELCCYYYTQICG